MKRLLLLACLILAPISLGVNTGSAQEFADEEIGAVDAVFGLMQDTATFFGSFEGSIPSGMYPASIENADGFLDFFDVEIDGERKTLLAFASNAWIPNDGTPLTLKVYSDETYTTYVSLMVFAGDPPVYPGTPHQPKTEREPWDPTKIPVFRGGDDFTPLDGEIQVDKDGNVKIGSTGPSINTDPEDPNVTKKGPHQIVEIPEGIEIVQQGIKPDKTLKTHGIIRPTKPMKPDEFKALLKKIVVKPFDPTKS